MQPTDAQRIVSPHSHDLFGMASYYAQRGESYDILVLITEEYFAMGKKAEVMKAMQPYGKVINESHLTSFFLRPRSLEAVQQLETDYRNDRLPGVEILEVDQPAKIIDAHPRYGFLQRLLKYF